VRRTSRVLITVAALATLSGYFVSHAVAIKIESDGDKIVWAIEGKSVPWEPAAITAVTLASLYTGRIDWIINAAEKYLSKK
jgi:hypothetical protein